MTGLAALLQAADLDGLVREVDRLAVTDDWDGVLAVRAACVEASAGTGRQLWGPAQYAEYRTALDAPGPLAASVVVPGAARFSLGPLTEVLAQRHAFAEVADHLTSEAVLAQVAQERVIRGEDLSGDPRAHLEATGLPGVLQPWEPRYPLPEYRTTEVLEAGPAVAGRGEPLGASRPGRPVHDLPEVATALVQVAAPWADASTGEVHVAVVEGDARAAVAAVVPGEAWLRRVPIAEAFAWLAWAAASGGARGRRRGLAAGRAAAWWVGHQVADLVFPADPDDLEFELEERRWYVFTDGDDAGWRLRLAVEDDDGWAAAVDAFDQDDASADGVDHDRGGPV